VRDDLSRRAIRRDCVARAIRIKEKKKERERERKKRLKGEVNFAELVLSPAGKKSRAIGTLAAAN
jgi:hypothetical protein